jgi:hypothetical protein
MSRSRTRPPVRLLALAVLVALAAAGCIEASGGTLAPPRLTRVFRLPDGEGVFAYARISPDGRYLAYAAQLSGVSHWNSRVIRVVELSTGRIVFTEPGVDAYFSPDGRRIIFLSLREGFANSVSILDVASGGVVRDVASPSLGDYFSWARRGRLDLILTIANNYYLLDGDRASAIRRVPPCNGIGTGERPLVSKDGRRITTFVGDIVAVRNLDDCHDIVVTGIRGAKADFSFDGRFIAFHSVRPSGRGYELKVVDLERRTVHGVADLPGSSLFPNWTRDGRLLFEYEADDFKGFVIASGFQHDPAKPWPTSARPTAPPSAAWHDAFESAPSPANRWRVVLIWAPWSAHTPEAFAGLRDASRGWAGSDTVSAFEAVDPGSRRDDPRSPSSPAATAIGRLIIRSDRFAALGATNQMPTYVVFDGDRLAGRLLGAQSGVELTAWVRRVQAASASSPSNAS